MNLIRLSPRTHHVKRRSRLSLLLLPILLISLYIMSSPVQASAPQEVQSKAIPYAEVPIYIDGQRASVSAYIIQNGVTYLPLRAAASLLLRSPSIYWDPSSESAVVKTRDLTLTARPGDFYIVANGRYFALSALYPAKNVLIDGVTYVPLRSAVNAMGGNIRWNASLYRIEIENVTGTITPADAYYNRDSLYWLSRIIYAEAGDQELRGQIAVGSVIMNRLKSDQFPNTVYGVIFDRKFGVQFTPVANGAIYNTPSQASIIAAKLTLEGCRISPNAMYFLDPSIATSFWIVENRQALFSIGCHDFYS
ncbi:MAG: cell wall hydrolase [Clostridia bacterium]|nr:cell wall hydrolase [Clostridia bacterium]